ncbi:unnamed protein product [Lampetra fluviatilis]
MTPATCGEVLNAGCDGVATRPAASLACDARGVPLALRRHVTARRSFLGGAAGSHCAGQWAPIAFHHPTCPARARALDRPKPNVTRPAIARSFARDRCVRLKGGCRLQRGDASVLTSAWKIVVP